jgi:MFS family permease
MLRLGLLLGAVALAFADSSIVVLALPDVIERFGASVEGAAGVVVAYNLALALVLAIARRARDARTARIGLAVFAVASAGCALAPGLWPLVALRALQGAGAGLFLPASLALARAHERGRARWSAAALAGTAVGPALGGALTQAFDWRSIFVVQVPVALAALAAARGDVAARVVHAAGRARRAAACVALALVSAALVALLFLAVLLLVDVWGLSPLGAAAAVSVVPAAMLAARFVDLPLPASLVALAGGLAALGLVPDRRLAYAVTALALAGAGVGSALSQLDALADGGALLARHAGLVAGLLLLTPILAADLSRSADTASRAATAAVLESPAPARAKAELALRLAPALAHPGPDSLRALTRGARGTGAQAELARAIDDGVRAAITRAFRSSFLAAAVLALAALGVAVLLVPPGRLPAYAAAAGCAAVLVGAELGAGALGYGSGPPTAPCSARAAPGGETLDLVLQRAVLRGLDAVACRAGTSRETLVLDGAARTQAALDEARHALEHVSRGVG